MKTETKALTKKINDGRTVLAKETKYGVYGISYCNRTQAERAAEKLRADGIECFVSFSRPFFVCIAN